MRDTYLGLNQKNVLVLKEKYVDGKGESLIKTEDLILIRRIQDFIASSKTIQVIMNNEIYSWVHYEVIQEDLPMIFPSVVSVKKRVEKLKKMGLIVNKAYTVTKEMISKEKEDSFDKPGAFSVIRLSKECRTMFDFTNMETPVENTNVSEGFNHEGVKGQHHEGVKGQHHEGVIKEYHESNTIKKIPRTCKEQLVPFENFFKEELKMNFTATNQKAIEKLLKTMNEQQVKNFLMDNYKMAVSNKEKDPTVKTVEGLFCHYLKKEERIPEYVQGMHKEKSTKKELQDNPVVVEEAKEIVINCDTTNQTTTIVLEYVEEKHELEPNFKKRTTLGEKDLEPTTDYKNAELNSILGKITMSIIKKKIRNILDKVQYLKTIEQAIDFINKHGLEVA